MTDGLKDAHREAIIATLAANDRVERAVLFGSRATGTNTVSSDVDIALFGDRLTLTDQARLAAALDEIPMAQSVDLLLCNSIKSPTLLHHIQAHGIELYAFREKSRSRGTKSERTVRSRSARNAWAETRLGQVIELKRGYDLPGRERLPGPAPVVSSSGVTGYHRESKVPGPGVVTGRYGTLGEVYFIPGDFWPLNTTLYVRDFKGNDPRFISYLLRGLDFSGHSDKAAVPGLNRNHLHEEPVRVPTDVREQRAIAHILGTLDDKIELNRRMNATLEAMARALFRSWFVDFEPVRAKMEGRDTGLPKEIADLFPDRMVDSELGEVPEEWAVGVLDDAVELLNGGTPRTSVERFWNGGIPWYTAKDAPAPHDVFAVETERTITQAGVDNSATVVLPSGTTIISARGSVGRLACLGRPMAMNQTCYGIRGAGGYGDFFTYWLVRGTVEELRSRTHGTIFDTITRQTFALVNSALPPLSIVGAFESVVLPIMERILSNLNQSVAIAALRDTLLPRLVSGELRVTGLEAPSRADDRPASVGTHEA